MIVPFYNIDRYYHDNREAILKIADKIFTSGKVLEGDDIKRLEDKLASFCGRKFAVTTGSCTDALYFSLCACGIQPGDEVIVTGFSFIASVSPVLRAGAIPVFTDIDPHHFTMDISRLEAKITPNTKAIIAVHLFGQMLNIAKVADIAAKHHLKLIEDAAQALGSEYNGTKAGSTGACSCFSFDPSKIISAFGNGGALLTDDEEIYLKAMALRYHGKNAEDGDFKFPGYNSRMSSLQAAMMCYQLDDINRIIYERNKVANKYAHGLNDIQQLTLPSRMNSIINIYHKYVIKVHRRDELLRHLKSNGVEVMVHYGKALFEYGMFSGHSYNAENIIHIHEVKKKVLSLPLYPELTDEETDYIIMKIREFYQ